MNKETKKQQERKVQRLKRRLNVEKRHNNFLYKQNNLLRREYMYIHHLFRISLLLCLISFITGILVML